MSLTNESLQIFTVSRDGALFQWAYVRKPGTEEQSDEAADMRWRIIQRHYFMQTNARVTCAAFHATLNLLVVGFSSGIFGLYEMPEFNQIHTLRYVDYSQAENNSSLSFQHLAECDRLCHDQQIRRMVSFWIF